MPWPTGIGDSTRNGNVDASASSPIPTEPSQSISTQVIAFANMVKPPNFFGKSTERIKDWLEFYNLAAVANSWPQSEMARRLPTYLDGTARKWYLSWISRHRTLPSWQELSKALISTFSSRNKQVAEFDEMQGRMMKLNENMTEYFFDKQRLCLQYNSEMSEEEQVSHIMRGLTPMLLDRVYHLQPKDTSQLFDHLQLVTEGSGLSACRARNIPVARDVVDSAAIYNPDTHRSGRGVRFNFDDQDEQPLNDRYEADQNHDYASEAMADSFRCFNCTGFGHYARDCPSFPLAHDECDDFYFEEEEW